MRWTTGLLLACMAHASFAQSVPPRINEFVVNHTGSDRNEYIEVYGRPGTDYAAFTLLEIEGDAGATLGVVDGVFPIGTTDGDGYWTTGFLNSVVENGTVTFYLVKGFTGDAGMDLDADDDGRIDPSPPWKRLVDAVAVTDNGAGDRAYSAVVLTPSFDGQTTTPGGASRLPNGIDTDTVADWRRNDFDGDGLPRFPEAPPADDGEAVNTPGRLNRPGIPPPPPPAPPGLILNEIDADTPGSDTREFIELYDGGLGHTPLDDLVLVFYNGQTDRSYRSYDLDGHTTNADGFFVLGGPDVHPAPDVLLPSNALQNGTDAVALYAGDADDFPTGTPVTTAFLVDAVVYHTDDPVDPTLLSLLHPGERQVNEKGRGNSATYSIQRLPNGSGGARRTATYRPFLPTPGTLNGGADLSLRMSAVPEGLHDATRAITYILRLSNDGPAQATGIEVKDHLPQHLTFVHATSSQGDFDPVAGVWHVGALAPNDVALMRFTVTAPQSLSAMNSAEVTAVQQPDPDSTPGDFKGDDYATSRFSHPPLDIDRYQADLRLSMTATPATTTIGEPITFTLAITNDGPASTAGVVVTSRLADGLSYVSSSGDGHYDPATGRWDLGRLLSGATKHWTITTTALLPGLFNSTATITHSTLPDPDSYPNNEAPGEDDFAAVTIDVQASSVQATGAEETDPSTPLTWAAGYPNPFRTITTFPLYLPEATPVTITIHDLLGRARGHLINGRLPAGQHFIQWNATHYSTGTYLIRLQVEHEMRTQLVTVVR